MRTKKTCKAVQSQRGSRQLQRGLSLVELLVALAIGMLITVAVTTLAINTSRSGNELSKVSRQVENGRYAMQLLSEQIRHAGFYGRYVPIGDPPTSLPDVCSTDPAVMAAALAFPVQAFATPGDLGSAIKCAALSNHVAGTDLLVIRRVSSDPVVRQATSCIAPADPFTGDWVTDTARLYFQSTPTDFVLANAGSADFTLTERSKTVPGELCRAQINRYRTDIYYIALPDSNTALCDGAQARSIPTLMRIDVTPSNAAACNEPLVEGIDRIRYDFGIDTSSKDGVPNSYVRLPGIGQLATVMTVHISLLARSDEPSPGYTDQKTYAMSLDAAAPRVGPFSDEFRRRMFSSTSRLTNQVARLEVPATN